MRMLFIRNRLLVEYQQPRHTQLRDQVPWLGSTQTRHHNAFATPLNVREDYTLIPPQSGETLTDDILTANPNLPNRSSENMESELMDHDLHFRQFRHDPLAQ